MGRFKLTGQERKWVFYDVGNSAFTLLISTIIPIYFNSLADSAGLTDVEYLAYWGYAASVVTLIVAILGPTLGTLADTGGYKKPIFAVFAIAGMIGCISLGFVSGWFAFIVLFVIAKTGYSGSLIFYDSMLGDITSEDRMDNVSSNGYAWGYLGSCVPFIISLVIVLFYESLGISMGTAMIIAFCITAVWWAAFTMPLLSSYRQINHADKEKGAVRDGIARLVDTFRNVRKNRRIFLFLLAFFFYIDGVYTIIDMATAYGSALGLDQTGLLLALLVTQIVAFPFAILFGRLASRYRSEDLITVCIAAYFGIAVFAIFLTTQAQFWALAVFVGMFQGGIQALSRSYFMKIIPPSRSGEYFGLMDICGKGAAFIGTTLVSSVSAVTGDINKGVAMISVLFLIGMVLFRVAVREDRPQESMDAEVDI